VHNRSERPLRLRLPNLLAGKFSPIEPSTVFRIYTLRSGSSHRIDSFQPTLAPGDHTRFRIPLKPAASIGTHSLSAVMVAEELDEDGEVLAAWETSVGIEGIRFFSFGMRAAVGTGIALVTLLQILALPIGLALLGALLQQRQQENVQERQAWAAMLPVSHENNVRYYIPFLAGIAGLKATLDDCRPGSGMTEQQAREAVFYVLFVLRRIREIIDHGAGFYLMDRRGEEVVQLTWTVFDQRARRRLGYEDMNSLLDRMTPLDTISSFYRRIPGRGRNATIDKIHQATVDWIEKEPGGFAPLLLCFHVLSFEVNRIYRFWYGDNPEFPAKECREQMTRACQAPDPNDDPQFFETMSAAVKGYIEEHSRAAR